MDLSSCRIGVVGLGYVGLPLAVAFSERYETIGFDVKSDRVAELRGGEDRTREIEAETLKHALSGKLRVTDTMSDIADCNVYVVTVPTPIDSARQPDLGPLKKASEAVGQVLSKGDIVIYESTVYPGCTEEVCVPILAETSGLRFNEDFFCGYSPERINPGDKKHTVSQIMKVTSGSTPEVAEWVDALYRSVIEAGTHKAPSLKVAEAAKVIENSQRDLNIAFVNELAKIFHMLDIDTLSVLEAAGTKWNFLPFRPGLVGGHCIGVDPYYLTHKAQSVGYHPEIILAGRRLNDEMGRYVASHVIKLMIQKGHRIQDAEVLVLGITFKENCPDIRNSRVIDVIRELAEFGCRVKVYDPWADHDEVASEYGVELKDKPNGDDMTSADAVVLAVAHDCFRTLDVSKCGKDHVVVYDMKGILDPCQVDGRL